MTRTIVNPADDSLMVASVMRNEYQLLENEITTGTDPGHLHTKGAVGLGNVDNTSDVTKNAATVALTNKTITSSTNTIGGVTMGLGSDATGDMYYNNGGVFTRLAIGGTNQQLHVSAGVPAWFTPVTVYNPPELFYYAAFLQSGGGNGLIAQYYADSNNVLSYLNDSNITTHTMIYLNAMIPGGTQYRLYTSDWASATSITSAVSLGSYLYVLLLNGTTSYQLWRYTANNLAAGGTQVTFSGITLTYNNVNQMMTSDGTSLFFNYQAGNSSNDYVITKCSISGTVATFVSNTTCGSSAHAVDRITNIDGSGNIYGCNNSDNKIRKFNSGGTLQTTSNAVNGHYDGTTSQVNLNGNTFVQDHLVNSDSSKLYFMFRFYI